MRPIDFNYMIRLEIGLEIVTEVCVIEDKTAVVVVASYRSVLRNLVRFKALVCPQEPNRAALLVKPIPYNHGISEVSAGLNNTRQRDFVKVKAKIINFIERFTKVKLKLEKPENFASLTC